MNQEILTLDELTNSFDGFLLKCEARGCGNKAQFIVNIRWKGIDHTTMRCEGHYVDTTPSMRVFRDFKKESYEYRDLNLADMNTMYEKMEEIKRDYKVPEYIDR